MTDFFTQRSDFEREGSLDIPLSSLSFLEASTLLLYRTGVDLSGNDIPLASGFAVKMNFFTYLGAALMELALRGYVRMDEVKPLPNYARYNRVRSPSGPLLYLILTLVCISFLSICSVLVGLSFPAGIAGFLFAWLSLLILSLVYQEPARKGVQGWLIVMREPPVGDEMLDELLWRMQPVGNAMKVRDWLSFLTAQDEGKQWVRTMYDRIERQLQEQVCIQFMGRERAPFFGEVETLVLNRQNEQWCRLSNQLRLALLSGKPSDPYTTALLILLTIIPGTFQTPHQIRLPGQPTGRRMTGGIYQILSEPEEIEQARKSLRTLIDGDTVVADAIGPDLYDTLLHLALGIREGPKRR
ncbi:GPP34 family phosphoprotein [Tengunoibacter tsumagoiensis]|uniref:Uncharacterized protein n=1 Tax=Tengunoibacter tsumagoiensis TaxID=2014871 RepID=A0A402A7P1_9CHLR|nr:GPP34 family phosphoprotein [Tengunoibacter tsumagoiensis]GCE15187.1 hypothetical protein KTT_50460 [Tengunoibacter tsumagoiensis]